MNSSFYPKYVYDNPMFMITVSTVVIEENGVILVRDYDDALAKKVPDNDIYKFPSGMVKAGQESIQFSAVRHIKEQLDIIVKKDSLIPVDFRSEPERSDSGNIVDIGFVTILDQPKGCKGKWFEVDFAKKKVLFDNGGIFYYKDNFTLLERALDVALMVKN